MDKIFFLPAFRKVVKIKPVSIDNTVFRLHYRVTALFLVVGSLLISATQFFGDPINCIVPEKFPAKAVDNYCWVESTFTLPKGLHPEKKVGVHVPYKGVDKFVEGDEIIKHAYYQWVCIVLFIQACLFFIPHLLWKSWEGGKVSSLLMNLNKPTADDKESRVAKYQTLVKYFMNRASSQGDYFFKFFICEALCFINVVGQMFLMNRFLGGEFSTYGSDVFQFMLQDDENRLDPMIKIFPRMTKCIFHHFGPSGDVQKMDTFCVLPLNILNEKVYVFLWFWFVILAILTGISLISRLVMIVSSSTRYALTRSVSFLANKNSLDTVLHYLGYSEWFLLYKVGSNIDSYHFMELVDEMADHIRKLPDPYDSSESVVTKDRDTPV